MALRCSVPASDSAERREVSGGWQWASSVGTAGARRVTSLLPEVLIG